MNYNITLLAQAVIIKDNKILLQKRQNTGYCDGMYCLPGGHVEYEETQLEALIRELKEELNLYKINSSDFDMFKIIERTSTNKKVHYIDFIFKNIKPIDVEQIINNEPDKCEKLEWFELDELPCDMIPYQRMALSGNETYYDTIILGWD